MTARHLGEGMLEIVGLAHAQGLDFDAEEAGRILGSAVAQRHAEIVGVPQHGHARQRWMLSFFALTNRDNAHVRISLAPPLCIDASLPRNSARTATKLSSPRIARGMRARRFEETTQRRESVACRAMTDFDPNVCW
jgi:hypothetical protein